MFPARGEILAGIGKLIVVSMLAGAVAVAGIWFVLTRPEAPADPVVLEAQCANGAVVAIAFEVTAPGRYSIVWDNVKACGGSV